MKVICKNFKRYFSSAILVVLIATLTISYALLTDFYNDSLKASKSENKIRTENVFVIDAGHGGIDGGAVGESGILEKDINLLISKNVLDLLSISNIKARSTRNDDKLLYDENDNRSKKAQDVRNRVEFANQFTNPIFISIHQNKFPISKYSGLQVYYSKNNEQSKLLAELIQSTVKKHLQNDNNREIKESCSSIYVLKALPIIIILKMF